MCYAYNLYYVKLWIRPSRPKVTVAASTSLDSGSQSSCRIGGTAPTREPHAAHKAKRLRYAAIVGGKRGMVSLGSTLALSATFRTFGGHLRACHKSYLDCRIRFKQARSLCTRSIVAHQLVRVVGALNYEAH